MNVREKSNIISIIMASLTLSAVILFFYAQYNSQLSLCLMSVMSLFICNILFVLQNIKKRFLLAIFQITLFTFLLSRPLIGIVTGMDNWMGSGQQKENIIFAFLLVFLSLLFMPMGALIVEFFIRNKKQSDVLLVGREDDFLDILRVVSLIVFGITMFFYMIVQIEPVLFMRGKTYVEYYTSFTSQLPGYFHTIASFMKYSLCIFLATMPRKKMVILPLVLFVLSAVPMLLVGVRNPIMLNGLFVVIYYFVREVKDGKEKWIGTFEKMGLFICTPFLLAFMSMYSLIRSQNDVHEMKLFKQVIDFFYQQGTTFNTLQIGYGYRKGIEYLENHYTFGGMIDYIKHGTVGQKIWGLGPLPSGNCEVNGRYSNSLAHNLSYVSRKEEYLSGRGRGSSYLLETYFDWGYIGVILFSVFLGALFIFFLYRFGHNMLESTIILVSLTSIYFIPRAEATGWLTFIITIQFWLCICVVYFGTYCCLKIKKIRSKNLNEDSLTKE